MRANVSAPRHRAHERGMFLVEVLISILVVAAGMLALLRMQTGLYTGADLARQRTEATRLAHQKLEDLRFQSAARLAAGKASAAGDRSGEDEPVITSNTAYRRDWSASDVDAAGARALAVSVRWQGRGGEADTRAITLQTVVNDEAFERVGTLVVMSPPLPGLGVAAPRNNAVPWDAVHLDGRNTGQSVLPWQSGNRSFLVLNDADGRVVAQCHLRPDSQTDIAKACESVGAVLLQGYVSGSLPDALPSLVFDRLAGVAANPPPACMVERLTPAAEAASAEAVLRYRCLITPGTADPRTGKSPGWTARVSMGNLPKGVGVCRYGSSTPSATNEEHPEIYTEVRMSLDHQNYRLTTAGSCPDGTFLQPSS